MKISNWVIWFPLHIPTPTHLTFFKDRNATCQEQSEIFNPLVNAGNTAPYRPQTHIPAMVLAKHWFRIKPKEDSEGSLLSPRTQ